MSGLIFQSGWRRKRERVRERRSETEISRERERKRETEIETRRDIKREKDSE